MRLSCMRLFKKHPEVIAKFQELTDMIGWLEPDEQAVIFEAADRWLDQQMPKVHASRVPRLYPQIFIGPNNSGMKTHLLDDALLSNLTKIIKDWGDFQGSA